MSHPEALSPDKRRQIIGGAAMVFAIEGYEGASMSRIAEHANVSKGTLYNHFEGKAELFAAWVQDECASVLAYVFDLAEAGDDPRAVLPLIGARMVRMIMSDAGRTVHRVVLSEAAKFPELARVFFDAGPSRALSSLACWLARASADGRMRVPDPELAAEQFMALCQTRFKMRRELMLIDAPSDAEIGAIIGAAVEMFLNTYGP